MKKLIQKYKAIQKIGTDIDVPWEVWRCFGGSSKTITIWGDQISLGEDFVSLEEARAAVAWYADQLGGSVKWDK